MNYYKIDNCSIVDGTGCRVVLWVSGCRLKCKGCHNPETWNFSSGQLFDNNAKKLLFEALSKPYIKGITFSGGHPLEKESIPEIYNLILDIKTKFPNKDIWLYTGYELTIKDFLHGVSAKKSILSMCDIIVDGRYIEELRDITLNWRGSSNQRVIDVKKTLYKKEIVLFNN